MYSGLPSLAGRSTNQISQRPASSDARGGLSRDTGYPYISGQGRLPQSNVPIWLGDVTIRRSLTFRNTYRIAAHFGGRNRRETNPMTQIDLFSDNEEIPEALGLTDHAAL